ncbi:MAG: His/Gly/Thr/Pro-type tRNA ligase C-terminal domain-containing protein [Candidatus Hermodarchaeota archaeon]
MGVLITLVIGPNEMEENKVTIKNMISEKQKTIKIVDLSDEIYNIIEEYGNT